MNRERSFGALTVVPICLSLICAFPLSAAETIVAPDQRDGQVLQALLLHLLNDPKFDLTQNPTNGASILLNTRTPEKTGFIQAHQMHADTRGQTLPNDPEQDLRRRNSPPNAKPDTYDCVAAYYTNLTFDTRIIVTELSKIGVQERRRGDFQLLQAYPCARGFVTAYLPGYSRDGNSAFVRAGAGPSAHGATVTALLEKTGNTWTVKWYHVARYA
jgi:hypothetical protein